MKAVVYTEFGPPEVLQLKEVAKPTPGNNEVLIKICAAAVTSVDCLVRSFDVPIRDRLLMGLVMGFTKPRNPIPGNVLAGEVESAGKNVKRFKRGDQVFSWSVMSVGNMRLRFGAYAEYTCLPENGLLALKPTNMSCEEAAALPFGGLLALHYLRKAGIQSGQQVLVYGASGAVGTSAVQLARHFGARVTGVCSTANLELVRSLGADTVIDYTKEDFTSRSERYDLIFNAAGKSKAQLQCRQALAPNGKHITVDDGNPELRTGGLLFLRALAEAGEIRAVIDRCYSLEQIVEAHRYVDKGHKKGNVIITVGHDNVAAMGNGTQHGA